MDTVIAKAILAARDAYSGTDEEFVAAQNAVTYTLTPGRTCGYGTFLITFGPELADGMAAYLQAAKPNLHVLYMAGNIDFGQAAVQAMVDEMGPLASLPPAVVEGIKDLGRTANPLPFGTLTIEDLATAARVVEFDEGQTRQDVYAVLTRYNALMAKMDQLREAGYVCPTFAELEAMIEE